MPGRIVEMPAPGVVPPIEVDRGNPEIIPQHPPDPHLLSVSRVDDEIWLPLGDDVHGKLQHDARGLEPRGCGIRVDQVLDGGENRNSILADEIDRVAVGPRHVSAADQQPEIQRQIRGEAPIQSAQQVIIRPDSGDAKHLPHRLALRTQIQHFRDEIRLSHRHRRKDGNRHDPWRPSEADSDTRWSLLDILESHARSTALHRYPASADVRPRCPRFLRKNSTGIGWISPDRPSAPMPHRHALATPVVGRGDLPPARHHRVEPLQLRGSQSRRQIAHVLAAGGAAKALVFVHGQLGPRQGSHIPSRAARRPGRHRRRPRKASWWGQKTGSRRCPSWRRRVRRCARRPLAHNRK